MESIRTQVMGYLSYFLIGYFILSIGLTIGVHWYLKVNSIDDKGLTKKELIESVLKLPINITVYWLLKVIKN